MKMNETCALARYLAKKLGYHPKTPKECWDVDATFDFLYEKWGKMAFTAMQCKTDDDSAKAYFDATEAVLDKMCAKLEKQKSKWLCGNKLTVCDFQVAHMMWSYWMNDMHNCGEFYTKKCTEMCKARPTAGRYLMDLHAEIAPILKTRKSAGF